jgi:VanZ family protein
LPSIGATARAWLAVGLWITLIQIAASGPFSASETSRLIGPLLRWLFPAADAQTIASAHFAIRKAAHLVEYAILSLIALRALRRSFDHSFAWHATACLVLVLAVAVVDESRQARSALRTGARSDVALDVAGAATALAIACGVRRLRGARA